MTAVNKKLYHHYQDTDWLRECFFQFTPQALYGADFRLWYQMGGWNELYIPYSFVAQKTMLANVSVSLMDLLLEGEKKKGIQFATVGTLPPYRKQGLAKELMHYVLSAYQQSTDLFFLFANDTVLDFYPKFGFTRVEEYIFSATVSGITPRLKARKLDIHNSSDLLLIKQLIRDRIPVTEVFGATSYAHILLFYLPHYTIWYLAQEQIIFLASLEGDALHVYEIISKQAFSFREILPYMVNQAIDKVYFYFTPDKIDLPTVPSHVYRESPLFVKGTFPLKEKVFKFPLLAQT